MALINCTECKKEISNQAKKCPNCGFDFTKKQNEKIASKGCLYFFIIIFIIIVFVNLIPKSSDLNNNLEAYVYSQQMIENKLKSPGTAEFPTFQDSFVSNSGNIYTINSYVDSQNSFGATIRSNFTCRLKFENGLFYVEDININ